MSAYGDNNRRLLFVGGGNIAGAVACGLVRSGAVPPSCVTVYDIDASKFEKFRQCGISVTDTLGSASEDADLIFIAVKPNVVKLVIRNLFSECKVKSDAVFVSFAAAVPSDFIERCAGRELKIIRTMPSTPVLIGEGVIAASKNERVGKREFQYFCRLMSAVAHVEVTEESKLNPIIAVNGSSPAYVYLFVKSMLDASVKLGIPAETALPLILKTVSGSVSMIAKSGESLETLIQNVSSPNGTTVAALNSFMNDDFSGSVERAMKACVDRADEISREL